MQHLWQTSHISGMGGRVSHLLGKLMPFLFCDPKYHYFIFWWNQHTVSIFCSPRKRSLDCRNSGAPQTFIVVPYLKSWQGKTGLEGKMVFPPWASTNKIYVGLDALSGGTSPFRSQSEWHPQSMTILGHYIDTRTPPDLQSQHQAGLPVLPWILQVIVI